MTLPYERTRSVVETERFLREICRNSHLPSDIRNHAKGLLRHYPSADQVFSLGRLEEWLIDDEADAEMRRRLVALHQPLFCSSLARSSCYKHFLAQATDNLGVGKSERERAGLEEEATSGGGVTYSNHLGQVRIRASEVFNDDTFAAAWAAEPNAALGGESPEVLCATETGAQQVLSVLNAIEWGGAV
ncbi:MbcA/ParS/Xre antitoxin family protein [Halopseudomonas pachastrellae]|nr:MbcA/ParS/Xre antitoxin family protein [Halopseudomonas pachastrellae]